MKQQMNLSSFSYSQKGNFYQNYNSSIDEKLIFLDLTVLACLGSAVRLRGVTLRVSLMLEFTKEILYILSFQPDITLPIGFNEEF